MNLDDIFGGVVVGLCMSEGREESEVCFCFHKLKSCVKKESGYGGARVKFSLGRMAEVLCALELCGVVSRSRISCTALVQ